jgi:hypothetical protein
MRCLRNSNHVGSCCDQIEDAQSILHHDQIIFKISRLIMSRGMAFVAETAYLSSARFSFLKHEVHVVCQKKASAIARSKTVVGIQRY